uniref:RH1 domain-containing protein n=1 Tax=Setaria digitata TaxID=48799 RepID=A0A915PIF9_9BILA
MQTGSITTRHSQRVFFSTLWQTFEQFRFASPPSGLQVLLTSRPQLRGVENRARMMEITQNNSAMHSSTNSSSSEVVYGATGSIGSAGDDTRVMSEKVQMLASSIYKEFETMIQKNGEDSVKNLMPLVVNVLESLDLAYLEKEECSVDLEMLKEDNEQLMTQYEREKQLRRAQDQKCLEIEDSLVEQNRELESKIESLESIMRMLELKAKNASDHAARLEEREADQKAEFDKLHERYNVLLRTHIDHMERTKYLMGSEKFEMMQSMPLPSQQLRTKLGMAASVDASTIRGVSDLISAHMSQSTTLDVNLANHISSESDWHDEFGQNASDILQSPRDYPSSAVESPRELPLPLPLAGNTVQPSATIPSPVAVTNDAADSLGADLTGALVDPAEFASAGNPSTYKILVVALSLVMIDVNITFLANFETPFSDNLHFTE